MSYYHYTKASKLLGIVNGGFIKTSKNLTEKKEKPAVWLTKSPEWESACNVGRVILPTDLKAGSTYSSDEIQTVAADNDYMKSEIGMCRIVISEKLPTVSWAKFKYLSGISEESYNSIDSYSRSIGSPVDKWLCSFDPIPQEYWEGIELLVADTWVRWDGKYNITQFVELCMSCNRTQSMEFLNKKYYPEYVYSQAAFVERYKTEIVKFWEAHKNKKGYIEIYVTPEYEPYNCGFRFIEKRIKKSSFKPMVGLNADAYALVHFLWEETYTQYKVSLGYEKATIPGVESEVINK
jgi:hypothetical protein